MATRAMFVATRVVCNNTLQIALSEKSKTASRVTHRSVFDPMKVKQELGLFDAAWESFRENIGRMANVKMSDNDSYNFVRKLLVNPNKEADKQSYTVERDTTAILNRAKFGMGADATYGTLWGLVNGVTEFVDHESKNRVGDNALWSSWFGKGSNLKTKAYEAALELAL